MSKMVVRKMYFLFPLFIMYVGFLMSSAFSTEGSLNVDKSPVLSAVNDSVIYINSCGVLNQAGRTYVLTQSITTTGTCFKIQDSDIVLNGNGYTITGDGGVGDVGVYADFADNTVIKNLGIDNFYHSIFFHAGSRNRISNNKLRNGGLAIHMEFSHDNLIENNTIENYSSNGIVFEHSGNRNTFLGNKIRNVAVGFASVGGLISDSLFKDNEIFNTSIVALNLYNFVNGEVINNKVQISQGDAIYTSGDILLKNNSVINTNSMTYDLIANGNNLNLVDMSHIGKYQIFGSTFGAQNFLVGDSRYGKISFLSINQDISGASLSDDIQIKNNSVTLKTSLNPGLNVPAQITLYNIGNRGFANPAIKRNFENCPSNVCMALTPLDAQNVVFNVTGFAYPTTTYRIGDGNRGAFGPNIHPVGCYSKNGTCPEIY
mgnify:CR=1 FL=1